MTSNQGFLFLIVGKNEPLYEAEIHKRGGSGAPDTSVARQSYFVVHSSLDLVDNATWTSQNVGTIQYVNELAACRIRITCDPESAS